MNDSFVPSTLDALIGEPQSISETGLNPGFLYDLTLKIIYFNGELSGQTIANILRLPYANVVDRVLGLLIKEDLAAITGSSDLDELGYTYVVTQKGSNKAQEILARSQYYGPAPVALEHYNAVVRAQSIDQVNIARQAICDAFAQLVVSESMIRRIGPAVNSGRAIFLYGASGDGKTAIARSIATLFRGEVYVPFAVEVDGQVIKVYDASSHTPIEEESILSAESRDMRWVLCRRPFVVAGGELTLEALDLIFDPIAKMYQAPYQMRANNGVFLLDDFGRQFVRPRDLLNRWIVPLENRVDYLALQTGKKIEIPFDVLIIFSTNLIPAELVDEAFLRRIRHKIHVPSPTWDEFHEIFVRAADQRGVVFDEEGFQYLVTQHYAKAKRKPRAVHPRDLVDQIVDLAKFLRVEPRLTRELIDAAVEAYFVTCESNHA
jgi:predicted ATPase with chaperone activity